MAATQYMKMTTQELLEALKKYITDNKDSSSPDGRWFANYLKGVAELATEVKGSNYSNETRKAIATFQADEIQREIENRKEEIKLLEEKHKKFREAVS